LFQKSVTIKLVASKVKRYLRSSSQFNKCWWPLV